MSKTPEEVHNQLAGPIITAIITPVVKAGGNYEDVIVLLETIIAGTILFISKPDGEGIIWDAIHEGVMTRMEDLKATLIERGLYATHLGPVFQQFDPGGSGGASGVGEGHTPTSSTGVSAGQGGSAGQGVQPSVSQAGSDVPVAGEGTPETRQRD